MVTTTLIDVAGVTDRYRRPASANSPRSFSSSTEPVARVVDAAPRTISPVQAMVTGDVRPDAAAGMPQRCDAPMAWHQITTTVFGGRFAGLADDIKTRVGPPPPRRPSV